MMQQAISCSSITGNKKPAVQKQHQQQNIHFINCKNNKRRYYFRRSIIIFTSSASSSSSNKSTIKERKGKPIKEGQTYPAREHCSNCGLCDTSLITYVKDACAFLGKGMSRIEKLEEKVHGKKRNVHTDELRLGVLYSSDTDNNATKSLQSSVFYAKKKQPIEKAQWTGIVTAIALKMLQTKQVDAVVAVGSSEQDARNPEPKLCFTEEDILSCRGVKPSLSPSLKVFAEIETNPAIRNVLYIGVGCSVVALREVEQYLGLDNLYVLGTNCADNGRKEGFEKFVTNATQRPDEVVHYEFMPDYRVHLKMRDGSYEKIPYFSLPAKELSSGVIAESCKSCFDYVNGLADVVIGYMGIDYDESIPMHMHPQYVTVRNERGQKMIDLIKDDLQITPSTTQGDRKPFVLQTVIADDEAYLGKGPEKGAPRFVGNMIAWILNKVGPRGKEFGMYSLDYHTIRNYLYVNRVFGKERAKEHIPDYALRVVEEYDVKGAISKRLNL